MLLPFLNAEAVSAAVHAVTFRVQNHSPRDQSYSHSVAVRFILVGKDHTRQAAMNGFFIRQSFPPTIMQITLSKNTAAIQLERGADGQEQLGTISQLPEGAEIQICGPGFDARTIKVRWCNQYFFMFSQDLKERASAIGA
jgi:hypothetical protein